VPHHPVVTQDSPRFQMKNFLQLSRPRGRSMIVLGPDRGTPKPPIVLGQIFLLQKPVRLRMVLMFRNRIFFTKRSWWVPWFLSAHVDFERRILTVATSKTGEGRHIPINDSALAAFRALEKKGGKLYLFASAGARCEQ